MSKKIRIIVLTGLIVVTISVWVYLLLVKP